MSPAPNGLLLSAGDERLAYDGDLEHARSVISGFAPPDPEQADQRARMLAFLADHPDAHERTCAPGHLTAAALVLHADGERALLTLHRKLGFWLQLGGHCDGDANLPGVALREAIEESGISDLRIDPRPIDLDVHTIPARPGEPAHLHLDTRFLVYASPGARPLASDESIELGWFSARDAARLDTDDSVRRLFRIAFGEGP